MDDVPKREKKKNVKVPQTTFSVSSAAYIEFVKCIEAILKTRDKLNKIKNDLAVSKSSPSYLCSTPAQIAKKLKRLGSELHRVRAIIEFQSQIQIKLQNYNFQSSNPLRLNHHKAILELINVMPKMTTELKMHVLNLEWFVQYQPGSSVERIAAAITQTFSLLDYTTEKLREFYNVLTKLHRIHAIKKKALSDEEILSNYDENSFCDWKEQKKLNELLLEPTYFVQYSKNKFYQFGLIHD